MMFARVMMFACGAAGTKPSNSEILAAWQDGLDFVSSQIANHPTLTGVGDPDARSVMGLNLAEVVLSGLMAGHAGWLVQDEMDTTGSSSMPNYWEEAGHRASFCESKALYVRREIRDLNEDERTRLFDAMRTMGTVGGEAGREMYGERYVSFGELAVLHAYGAVQLPCDATHVYGQFLPWHRTYNTRVQQSIWAIDPEAPVIPYYDFGKDVVESGLERVEDWEVFSETMFGDFVGERDNGFAVPKMMGGDAFPIPTDETDPTVSEIKGPTPLGNPAGVLRPTWNPLSSAYVSRLPPNAFGVDLLDTRFAGVSKGLEALIHNASDAVTAYGRIENPVGSSHLALHMYMGSMIVPDSLGRVPGDDGYNATEVFGPMDGDVISDDCKDPCADLDTDCAAYDPQVCADVAAVTGCECPACSECTSNETTSEFGPTWFADAPDIVKFATATIWTGTLRTSQNVGCVSDAPCATPVDGVYDAACVPTVDRSLCTVPPIISTVAALPGINGGIIGDMNTIVADSDPIFLFHHANVDRLFYEWQAKQVNEGLYPFNSTAGADPLFTIAPSVCPTHGSDDEIFTMPDNDYFNWSSIFKGIYPLVNDRAPTNRDTLVLANLDYTYDTVCAPLDDDPLDDPDVDDPAADDPAADDPGTVVDDPGVDDPGAVVDDASGGDSSGSSKSKKSSKGNTGLVAGVAVAAIVILAGIIAFICYAGKKSHSPPADVKESDNLVGDAEEKEGSGSREA